MDEITKDNMQAIPGIVNAGVGESPEEVNVKLKRRRRRRRRYYIIYKL